MSDKNASTACCSEPNDHIPDDEKLFRIARGASPAAKYILAVAALEIVRDEVVIPHDNPSRENVVILPADSPPLRSLKKLFDRRLDEAFLRELASIPLEYATDKCFVMKPIFRRVESRRVEIYGKYQPEIVLHFENAFDQWARSERFFEILDRALDWPVGLLEDLLKYAWKDEHITRTRPSYLVVDRPRVCPFCGRESVVEIENGFFHDDCLFNAIGHDLLGIGGCCVDYDTDPKWTCAGCGLGFMQAAPDGHCVDRRSIREYLAEKAAGKD